MNLYSTQGCIMLMLITEKGGACDKILLIEISVVQYSE